jgi:hypothetical protein
MKRDLTFMSTIINNVKHHDPLPGSFTPKDWQIEYIINFKFN